MGGNAHQRDRLRQHLQALSADPGLARGRFENLRVAFLAWPPSLPREQGDFRKVDLDLSPTTSDAVVIVADEPLSWNIVKADDRRRAQVALDGTFAPMITGAPRGLLAGYRIANLGARETLTARSLATIEHMGERRKFCRLIRDWMEMFDLRPDDVTSWQVLDGRDVALKAGGVTSASGSVKDFGTYNYWCGRDFG